MSRTVTVGLDGSQESRAAAEWAAREAKLRGLPLKIVHVWEPFPAAMAQAPLLGPETRQHWSERLLRESAEGLRLRHPGVEILAEQIPGGAAEVLSRAAEDSELLVLGSRPLSGIGGFMVGSVAMSVVAHATEPVVLVRAGEQAADEHELDPVGIPSAAAPFRPVVLGLDTGSPDDSVIEFAFVEAARRYTSLHVVHGWNPPPYYAYGLAADVEFQIELGRQRADALAEVLRPWRQKFPAVIVTEECRFGQAAGHLIDASHDASLVVVGRRIRRNPFGAHIGHVTHAVLHHSTVPVAVVAHG
ncbi:universal stress protein [Streptomyces sp. NBC_01451]|uniref:universal stress protein n=1 Tax=Streptomyces sp. NBC_01451 TaxID=2903872 RepID=UPI002E2F76E8|nr:universal stress protein [Streptomyces sp. NBC_01451]